MLPRGPGYRMLLALVAHMGDKPAHGLRRLVPLGRRGPPARQVLKAPLAMTGQPGHRGRKVFKASKDRPGPMAQTVPRALPARLPYLPTSANYSPSAPIA